MKGLRRILASMMIAALAISCVPVSGVQAKDSDSVPYQTVDSVDSLQNYINTDGAYSSQDTIQTDWKGEGAVHKISVDEPGWIYIRNNTPNNYTDCNLYSNAAITNLLAKGRELVAAYVPAGNYYYQVSRWNGTKPLTSTCYVGFMAATERIAVDKITYSKDRSVATVSFDYDADYLGGFNVGTIRVVNKAVPYTKLKDEKTWVTKDRANALTKNSFKATKNGTYTARIGSPEDAYYCMVTFEIKGLKSSKPAVPKILSYKKSSRTISGTALANTKVVIKVSGTSYTANVASNGKWKITLKSPLRKGQKITGYVKNSAGIKSNTTSKVVK